MSDFKAKVHKIRFPLRGPTFKGREWKRKGRGKPPPKYFGLYRPW